MQPDVRAAAPEILSGVSLLYPPGRREPSGARKPGPEVVRDLDLPALAQHLSSDVGKPGFAHDILLDPCTDCATIRYRQEVLQDVLALPGFSDRVQELLPEFASIRQFQRMRESGELLKEVCGRLGELEIFVDCVNALSGVLGESSRELRSQCLRRLSAAVSGIQEDAAFKRLSAELPGLLGKIRSIAAVTVGINLDRNLRPSEATLLAVNTEKFSGASGGLFQTLFGRDAAAANQGIASLHSMRKKGLRPASGNEEEQENPLLVPLFRDLSGVLDRVSRPISRALRSYISINAGSLLHLADELRFYVGAARLVRRIRSMGLPMCVPRIAEMGEKACRIEGLYDPNLAIRFHEQGGNRQENAVGEARRDGGTAEPRQEVVTNRADFQSLGRVFILTGPNRGGKTTYMKAVGTAQVLAQAGLFVPGREAVLSPVDGIFTHFPMEERPEIDAGRLGEEAQRLAAIFDQATPFSLVLLNESLADTSPAESLHLCRDVVQALLLLGARAVFTTHQHALAEEVDALNAEVEAESRAVSLVSLTEGGDNGAKRTYRIVPRSPTGRSHAEEIARRYGISFGQLRETLRRRGILRDA